LIGRADLLRQKGSLIKAAKILKRADTLILTELRDKPGNKILLAMKNKQEKCWNKIIDRMARSKL